MRKGLRYFLFFSIITFAISCVSMKKFSSSSLMYNNLQKDSIDMAVEIIGQNNRIDKLIRQNISLQQDTLRLFGELASMTERYDRDTEESRQEIVRLNSQLYGTTSKRNSNYNSINNSRILKVANSISKSIDAFDKEIRTIFWKYDKSLYNIENKNWELVITLCDSLLYQAINDNGRISYDNRQLTKEGEFILSKLASIIIEKDNLDVIVKESILVNSPSLQYIPSAKSNTFISEQEIKAIIDTLITANQSLISEYKSKDTMILDNAVIDITQSNLFDSINFAKETERIRQNEINRLTLRTKEKESRKASDRTTVIISTLMKYCYHNMGSSKISRDVSYIKVDKSTTEHDNGWIEITLKPNLSELYNIIHELEKRQNSK